MLCIGVDIGVSEGLWAMYECERMYIFFCFFWYILCFSLSVIYLMFLGDVADLYPGPPFRTFPIPVSHLEQSLYAQMRAADLEVLALMEILSGVSNHKIEEEIRHLSSMILLSDQVLIVPI